jgi:dTDP-4-dehydrorhamnose reductase
MGTQWSASMVLGLLGATGYVGSEFTRYFNDNGLSHCPISRQQVDIYSPQQLAEFLHGHRVQFLINCAGFTGKPNVDACETQRTDCLLANAVLPGLVARACQAVDIPWGHVSSGCIYTGAKSDGSGFTELDAPNFSFRQNNCSFYSGCKALGEECLTDAKHCYIWRLRIPFDHRDSARNYLSKVMRYPRLLDARNSLSHLSEFVTACYACYERRLDYGIYNLTNSGSLTTREVVELIRKSGLCDKQFDFFESEQEFMQIAAKAARSNTVLDNSKALAAGLMTTGVRQAVESALQNWVPESLSTATTRTRPG